MRRAGRRLNRSWDSIWCGCTRWRSSRSAWMPPRSQAIVTGGEDSLWQFGHSKDDPTLRQIKAMMATLDPLGLPLALEVVSGEQADDPLYIPLIDRVLTWLGQHSLLFVGDSKMSALATRGHLEAHGQ